MTIQTNIGYFGKIPSKGDFVSRHLPNDFIQPWDQWLQNSLTESQEQLGNQWLDLYLTCPIWRFALCHGICGDSAWIGIFIPSVDQVGRYFPLSFALPVTSRNALIQLAAKEEQWFSQLEKVALTTLDIDANIDDLNVATDSISPPLSLMASNPGDVCLEKQNLWRLPLTNTRAVGDSFSTLLEQLLWQQLTNFSFWWSNGSEHVEPSALFCNQLPSPSAFTALLDGNWQRSGWDNNLARCVLDTPIAEHVAEHSS